MSASAISSFILYAVALGAAIAGTSRLRPCGPLLHYDEVFTDPHIAAREMYVATEHSRAGTFKTIGVPVKLSETPGAVYRAAPGSASIRRRS